MSTENKTDWQKRECGALWKKESPTQKFFSGHVKVDDYGEEKLLKDSHPDFRIYTVDDKKPQSSDTKPSNTEEPVSQEAETEEVL